MTISRLHVFLGGVFDYGQAYVALSRATSLDRTFCAQRGVVACTRLTHAPRWVALCRVPVLKVDGFDPKKVRVHPRYVVVCGATGWQKVGVRQACRGRLR